MLPPKANSGEEIPELLNWTEEEDIRIVLYVEGYVRVKQYHRVVLLSNDTDSFALLVHYAQHLQTLGVKDSWQQYGNGEKRHMLPLHQAVSQFGAPFAKTVIRGHILTGDDYMRKVGTKHAAMACTSRNGRPTWYVSGQGPGQLQLVRYSTSLEWNIIRTPELEMMLVLLQAVPPEAHPSRRLSCQQSMPTACHRH